MVIFVIFEWCYATMAIMLHRKIKRLGSLLLAGGLTMMAFLVTVRYILNTQAPGSVFLTRGLPVLMMITSPFALVGLGMIVAKWEEYTGKK